MITIRYTQCEKSFSMDSFSAEMAITPELERVKYYKEILSKGAGEYSTVDALMLEVGWWLLRHGLIKNMKVVEICNCGDENRKHDKIHPECNGCPNETNFRIRFDVGVWDPPFRQ